ncbi:MAG TPA: hypothetical protein VEC35_09445 [Noviherbaspirillum sp.]|nr:hypothetical protein [Noviherbaspirillum sp.]
MDAIRADALPMVDSGASTREMAAQLSAVAHELLCDMAFGACGPVIEKTACVMTLHTGRKAAVKVVVDATPNLY